MAEQNLLKHIRKMRDYERDILVLYINHYTDIKIKPHQLGLVSRKDALNALHLASNDKELTDDRFYWGHLVRLIKRPAWCPRIEVLNVLTAILWLEVLGALGLAIHTIWSIWP